MGDSLKNAGHTPILVTVTDRSGKSAEYRLGSGETIKFLPARKKWTKHLSEGAYVLGTLGAWLCTAAVIHEQVWVLPPLLRPLAIASAVAWLGWAYMLLSFAAWLTRATRPTEPHEPNP